MCPVRDGLSYRAERKPIIIDYYNTVPSSTETLVHTNDHLMVKIQLDVGMESVNINAMIDLVAKEDFIDREVWKKHSIELIEARNPRGFHLADGKPSPMGRVTHMTKVPIDISSQMEWTTFHGANLQIHEVLLRVPWLRKHNPTIDWSYKRITFNSE